MGLFDFLKKHKKEEFVKKAIDTTINQSLKNSSIIKSGEVRLSNVSTTINNIEKIKSRFISIDFETTGLSPYSDRIIEIGAVLFENGIIVNKFESFINPGISIPESAQRINHISNEMVKNAPDEATVIKQLVEFLGDAIYGNTFICAHNSNFDSKFLESALRRNEYDATLCFLDTLGLSRKVIYSVDNYKQESIANYFGIINETSHRAVADAETCGLIMLNLSDLLIEKLQHEEAEVQRLIEVAKLTEEQREWCAVIQNLLIENDFDTEYLFFRGQSANYVSCECIYSFMKIKFGKNKKYIIAKKDKFKNLEYITEPCTASEGGDEYLRILFNEPFEMKSFISYISDEYKKMNSSVKREISEGTLTSKNIEMYMRFSTKIHDEAIPYLLSSAKTRIEAEKINKAELELKKQRSEEEKQLKQLKRELEKQKKVSEVKTPRTRAIIQLNDDGSIVNEFVSISEAVTKTGVNSKSIRDAANGIQKHAGGFCWKYKEELTRDK